MAARKVFDEAQLIGYTLNLLDIGGGFPGFDQPEINFDEVTFTINSSINKLFPEGSGVRIIAEPGRYFAASAYTLAANVIAKREVEPSLAEDKTRMMYYINDGVYGSFNCILYDHAEIEVDYLKVSRKHHVIIWRYHSFFFFRTLQQSQHILAAYGDQHVTAWIVSFHSLRCLC